jgi:CO/xanthine dehydrogenase FAD-binding subunit
VERLWDEYIFADSIAHGLEILDAYHGSSRLMAGGTDLILRLQEGGFQTQCIVDITRIGDLRRVSQSGDKVCMGATVTHAEAHSNPLIMEQLPLLSEASSHVGTPQVRNQGTIVGNVINAQPAADTAVALSALDGEVCIESKLGTRWEPLGDLYEGVGRSRVDSTQEIATALRCRPIKKGEGWAYLRIRGRNDLWLPTLNTAIWISVSDGRILSSRIAMGPVAPRLFRAKGAEELLNGSEICMALVERASQEASREANPRDSVLRGSSDYRKELARVLVRRALLQSLERVGVNLGRCP